MKPLGWRFVVVTDVGAESGQPLALTSADADRWLAKIGAGAEVPTRAGAAAVRMPIAGPASFAPEAVRTWLAAQGAPADPAAVDAVLHHPAFQRAESAWRGMKRLLDEAGETVEVTVVSLPRRNLAARFRELVFEPARWSSEPTSLLVIDHDFAYKGDDLATLQELGTCAKALQAPVLAQANAGFFDLRYLVQAAPLGELLPRLMDSAHTGWRTFQATEAARWITLTINRWLTRAPYTADGGGHAETCAESNPDSYLWGRGVWLMAAAIARSARQNGHALASAGAQGGRFEAMPTRPYPVAANASAPLGVEAPLTEMQIMELTRFGFTPLLAPLRGDFVMVVSAMTAFRLRPAKPTLEGTLAYQMMAGRLAQWCSRMLDEMPAADAGSVAAFFRTELTGFLGPLAGEKPEEAVTVEVREEEIGGRTVPLAAVHVAPRVVLEGKPADFNLMLPLTR